jgi:cytochrome b subunit of formate dehydrogenase
MLEHRPEPASPDMVKLRVREGPTFVTNVPSLCGRCHGEGGQADVRYLGTQKNIVANYLQSVHGKGLLASGLTVTATCTSCHTAHRALPANDPRSSVHVTNTPSTCGNCHHGIYEQFVGSIHSPLKNTDYKQLKGQPPLPGCNDCHPPHSVIRTAEDEFRNGIIETCGKCHADVAETYFDTYHGKASRLEGGAKAAKCQDCHGAHDILPPMDLASHLSRTNIVDTCAKCHPGSNRQFAGYLTHATHHDPHKYPQLFYVFWGMTGLLVGTFGFFGLHTLIWLPRSWKLRRELAAQGIIASPHAPKQVVRFSSKVRRMHFVMILSFFGLALTGMMLKFSYMGWARFIARAVGGYAAAGFIHRVCAVVMVCLFIYHLWDARQGYKRSGKTLREFLFGANTILPQLRDLTEFVGTVKWFFGKGPRPQYGRWTYWEKFDYFAVFWGVAVIGSTGVFLWFPEFFTWLHVPGKLINVATIIHSDEALLATGFIFTIHFFNTNLRPEKFPMDLVMFTGRMPLDEFKHERPREHAELLSRGELDEKLAPAATPGFIRASRVFGAVALTVGMTLVLLIIYTMIWKYR